ncbi:hypothetical protein KSP39_PZI010151 [Platanthera zijinensis]|uniref:Uncharacterized protein n=1 Tax=Platanthera zijinensis TaxID=2320716 RepID=A0AAP0G6K3_9ASPA
MATKVTYIYPFTSAFGDSKGQEESTNKIKAELGWLPKETLQAILHALSLSRKRSIQGKQSESKEKEQGRRIRTHQDA